MKKEVLKRLQWVQSAPNVFVKFTRAVKASWDTSSEFRAEVKKFKKNLKDSWTSIDIGVTDVKTEASTEAKPEKDIKKYN